MFTFWWPKATKVKIEATSIKRSEAKTAEIFKAKEVGQLEKNSQEHREAKPNATTASLEIMSGLIIGLGFEAGRFSDPDTRYAVNLGVGAPLGEHLGCGPFYRSFGELSFRREKFVGNSFYYSLGPAIQDQKWSGKCEKSEESVLASSTSMSKRWEYGLVGVDVGIGNEWRTTSGFFGGCEWAGAFVGATVWKRGGSMGGGASKRGPLPATPRFLSCKMGLSF